MRYPFNACPLPIALMAVVPMGCAATNPQPAIPQPKPMGAEYPSTDQELPVLPSGTVTLEEALELARLRNPELASYSIAIQAAEARVRQAGVFPNPELEFELGEYDRGGKGSDLSETSLVLGQAIELGGTRPARRDRARIEGELVVWDYASARLRVVADTKVRFVEALAAQHRIELAERSVELAEKAAQAVQARVRAGKEPAVQANKALAELDMAKLDALEARNGVSAARRRLSAMWGETGPLFKTVVGSLGDVLPSVPSLEALQSRLPTNPNLARWDAERRLREAALLSERADRIPDVEVSVGFQQFEEDDTDALAFGVGIPLPLFDRNRGGIAAAESDLAMAQAEIRTVHASLAADLAEAHARLASAHAKVSVLGKRIVPTMKKSFEAAQEGYRQGKLGYLDVLDAQRSLSESRKQLVDALADYHRGVAEIERLAATNMGDLMDLNLEETHEHE